MTTTQVQVYDTAESIHLYRLNALRGALKLEILGMKRSGRPVYASIKKEFGFKGSKAKVLAQLEAKIALLTPYHDYRHGKETRKGFLPAIEEGLELRDVTLCRGDVLFPCNADGSRYIPYVGQQCQRKYTVSHWDDTWVHWEGGEKGEIGWLWPRIIEEGNPTKHKNPAMYKHNFDTGPALE
jgi:hypothetical protein